MVLSHHRNKTTAKPRGPRATTKSANSKRRTMSTSARKRTLRKWRNTKCDAIVAPEECDNVVETVPESQHSVRPTPDKNTPSRQTTVCG